MAAVPPPRKTDVSKPGLVIAVIALALALVGMVAFPGPVGEEGPQGEIGPQGLTGDDGNDGAQGPTGPQGLSGADGADGVDGVNGIACWDLNGNGTGDIPAEDINGDLVVDVLDCTGPQGLQGPQGPVGPQGPQGPAGPAGTGIIMGSQTRVEDPAVPLVGCTNFINISLTVPQAGIIVVTSSMHFWIQHFLGTTDGVAFVHRTAPTDCSLAFSPNPSWFLTEITQGIPDDFLINVDGTLVTSFSVPGAGTYTYYLNAEMFNGQSANDRIVDATTVAVFYSS